MTPADRARASRLAQGLPPTVTDRKILIRLALMCREVTPAKKTRRAA